MNAVRNGFKPMLAFLISLAFLLACADSVQALGIAPPVVGLDFEPFLQQTHSFYVRGEDRLMKVNISVRGPLSEYIKPDVDVVTLGPGEVRYFDVTIELPGEIEKKGLLQNSIVVREMAMEDRPGVAALTEVSAGFDVYVPYPGKYMDAVLVAENVALSEPVLFMLALQSRGEENTTASAKIEISDITGKTVATLNTNERFVEAKKAEHLEVEWDSTGFSVGKYFAKATVEYGGDKPAIALTQFKIGDVLLAIDNLTYKGDIQPDDIAKLDLVVGSYWNQDIEDVFASMTARHDGASVGTSTSETFGIKAWETKHVPIYWDTHGLEPGQYELDFVLNYAGRTAEKTFNVEVKMPTPEGPDPLLLVLTAVIIIAAVIVAFFLYRKKRKKNA